MKAREEKRERDGRETLAPTVQRTRLNGLDGEASPTSAWSAANVSADPGNREALGTITPPCSSEFERKTYLNLKFGR